MFKPEIIMKIPQWLEILLDALFGRKSPPTPVTTTRSPTTQSPTTQSPTTWPPVTTTSAPSVPPAPSDPSDGPPPIPGHGGGTTAAPVPPTLPDGPVTTTQPPVPSEVHALLDAHNNYRASKGLPPMTLDSRLITAAQKYARVMAVNNHFSHTGPDGRSPFDRIKAEGYYYRAAGENIAFGHRNVAEVMAGWIASPGHEANIRGNYSNAGFGSLADSNGRIYWVADFGTPSGNAAIPVDATESAPGPLSAPESEPELVPQQSTPETGDTSPSADASGPAAMIKPVAKKCCGGQCGTKRTGRLVNPTTRKIVPKL